MAKLFGLSTCLAIGSVKTFLLETYAKNTRDTCDGLTEDLHEDRGGRFYFVCGICRANPVLYGMSVMCLSWNISSMHDHSLQNTIRCMFPFQVLLWVASHFDLLSDPHRTYATVCGTWFTCHWPATSASVSWIWNHPFCPRRPFYCFRVWVVRLIKRPNGLVSLT